MINPNDPAFPVVDPGEIKASVSNGLSIRAELAARAMQGILANPSMMTRIGEKYASAEKCAIQAAKLSIVYADALITELNKTSS